MQSEACHPEPPLRLLTFLVLTLYLAYQYGGDMPALINIYYVIVYR